MSYLSPYCISQILVTLVKAGIVSLSKDKIYTNEFPGTITSANVDEALTPAEENEILKESEANDIYLRLDGSNAKGRIENRTSVTTTPYTVEKSDHHLSITTSSIAITLNLPSIIDGTVYHIKDQNENSEGKNITISPDTGETIENASNLIINTNGASVTIIGNDLFFRGYSDEVNQLFFLVWERGVKANHL